MSFRVPGKILEEYTVRNNRLGVVDFRSTHRPIFLDLVPEARIGDYVRVHVGFATETVYEDEAKREYEKLGLGTLVRGEWRRAPRPCRGCTSSFFE